MSKKVFKEQRYGIIEGYKPSKDTKEDSPIIGSFSVKGMTVEDAISQNRTKYTSEVWAQPTAFGKGGKFIDENGKLKPSTLFGSVDHPLDDRAQLLLKEAALGWYNVVRNEDGSWDGEADILNNPEGKLVKTFLDYAKHRGGGELLGVSSRAVGESVISEGTDGQYEAIVPEGFELMSFDFVYNPSFTTAVARVNESTKSKVTLVESVRNLAKEDKENANYYEAVADGLEKEVSEMGKKVIDDGIEIEIITEDTEEDSEDQGHRVYTSKEYFDSGKFEPIIESSKEDLEEEEDPDQEDEDMDDVLDDDLDEEDPDQEDEDGDDSDEEEEVDEDEEEPQEGDLESEISYIKTILQELRDYLIPVDDPETELIDTEEEIPEEELDEEQDEESDEESDEEEPSILDELTEEELDDLSDEDLEYLLNTES